MVSRYSLAAAIAALGAVATYSLYPDNGPDQLALTQLGDIDPIVTGALGPDRPAIDEVEPLGLFLLSLNDGEDICVFERGLELNRKSAVVRIEADCAALFAPLAEARHWQEGEDGTVRLIDRSGKVVLRFDSTQDGSLGAKAESGDHFILSRL